MQAQIGLFGADVFAVFADVRGDVSIGVQVRSCAGSLQGGLYVSLNMYQLMITT